MDKVENFLSQATMINNANLTIFPFENKCDPKYLEIVNGTNKFNLCLLTSREIYELSKPTRIIKILEMFHQHFQKPFMLEINSVGLEAATGLIDGRISLLDVFITLTFVSIVLWLCYSLYILNFFVKKVKLFLVIIFLD